MLRKLCVFVLCASAASAETADVPHLADGTVDVSAVLSSFEVRQPFHSNRDVGLFEGAILGKAFDASIAGEILSAEFSLTISSGGLSEEANYLAAVLLIDVICLQQDRSPVPVRCRDTASKTGKAWTVKVSCSTEPRLPSLNGSYELEAVLCGVFTQNQPVPED